MCGYILVALNIYVLSKRSKILKERLQDGCKKTAIHSRHTNHEAALVDSWSTLQKTLLNHSTPLGRSQPQPVASGSVHTVGGIAAA